MADVQTQEQLKIDPEWQRIKEQIDAYRWSKEKEIALRPGDPVEYEYKGEKLIGRVSYVTFDVESGEMVVGVEWADEPLWQSLLRPSRFVGRHIKEGLRRAANVASQDEVLAVLEEIDEVENDLDLTVRERDAKLARLNRKLEELRARCAHDWKEIEWYWRDLPALILNRIDPNADGRVCMICGDVKLRAQR